jgi:hypothetical protein
MTVNYTTNLALAQPVTGTESGTWGDDVNNGLTAYLDASIAGTQSIAITTADVTLSNTQGTNTGTNLTGSSAQYAILNITGAMTAARNLILPSLSKTYVVYNNTTGGFTLTIKGASTTGIAMVNGERAVIAYIGSDYVKIDNSYGVGNFTSLSVGSNTNAVSSNATYTTLANNTVTILPAVSLIPSVNASYACGASSYRWTTVFSSIGDFSSSITVGGNASAVGASSTNTTLGNNTVFVAPAVGLAPAVDNSYVLGSGSFRWSTVYAATGTINTSDATQKQQDRALSDAERAVAARIKGLIKTFKFNDAVAKKGDEARIHIGVYAQEVQAAFAAEGLDAEKYALFCRDEVDGQNIYGVRYEELLAFVIAVM